MLPLILGAASLGKGIYDAVSGNQDRQRAKGQQGKVTGIAEQNYADRSPYRSAANQALLAPKTYDFGQDYEDDALRYRPVGTSSAKYGTEQDSAVSALTAGPNRRAMAAQALTDLDRQDNVELDARYKQVGQRASALGRIGSGGVTSELGTVLSDVQRNREIEKNRLVRDLTERDADDRYRTIDTLSGLNENDLAGQRGERAFESGLAERRISNRERARDAAAKAAGFDLSRGLDLAGLGFGDDRRAAAYQAEADASGDAAAANEAGAGDLFALAGDLYGRYKPVASAKVPKGQTVAGGEVYG